MQKKYEFKKENVERTTNIKFSNDNQLPRESVDLMTSREFQGDTRAHIEFVGQSLKDNVMLQNYQTAITWNKHLFRNKTVLNIGCGIGILALFAAKAGAKHVYAVDHSNVLDYAQRIITANRYDKTITLFKSSIKKLELPVKTVDIIICDWIGYSMLIQSICDDVIYARDKWLTKDGLIFPDKATLYIGALEDRVFRNERIEWWNDVYGFNMNCLRGVVLSEPSFRKINTSQIITTVQKIKTLDLNLATHDDLKVRSRFMFKTIDSGSIDGVFTYCDIEFTKSHTEFKFSTSPWAQTTHLLQSVFYFDKMLVVNDKDSFFGGIEITPNAANTDLNNMLVAIEFFSGEPELMNLEIQMVWHLKQHESVLNNLTYETDTQDYQSIKNKNKTKHEQKKVNGPYVNHNISLYKKEYIPNSNITNTTEKCNNETVLNNNIEISKHINPNNLHTDTEYPTISGNKYRKIHAKKKH